MTCECSYIFYYSYIWLQIDYPEIVEGVTPRHRFMAAYEQKVEPPDRKWQYLLFAVEPYETIAFKVKRCGVITFYYNSASEKVWCRGSTWFICFYLSSLSGLQSLISILYCEFILEWVWVYSVRRTFMTLVLRISTQYVGIRWANWMVKTEPKKTHHMVASINRIFTISSLICSQSPDLFKFIRPSDKIMLYTHWINTYLWF